MISAIQTSFDAVRDAVTQCARRPSFLRQLDGQLDVAVLALPIFLLLVSQMVLMVAYAVFVTYRLPGRNYDAAVLAAGHCGFGLGATPTAIANMQAVTARFGPSRMAFLIVLMVNAFFIDIANAIVIKLFWRCRFTGAAAAIITTRRRSCQTG